MACSTARIKTILLALLLLATAPAWAQETDRGEVRAMYVAATGLPLESLAAGDFGRGYLLYYLSERGPERPSLVVHLLNARSSDGIAVAEVFHAPDGMDHVPVRLAGGTFELLSPEPAAIVIEALGGWWVRRGVRNFNLDVRVYGPLRAMWGIDLVPEDAARIGPDRHSLTASIRDPFGEGIPVWEARFRVPAFARRGYYRASYAERKCDSPLQLDGGVTPLWPFVDREGLSASFLQPRPGILRPPILVEWETGRIAAFSEVVTVRNQNCSYSFYSIAPVVAGERNDANFETPFAFYDFSGEGRGLPNYLIRTERYSAHDPFSENVYVDSESELDGSRPVPRDLSVLRVSWRNRVGDGRWDYALQLMGFHPYDFDTDVAGGAMTITAPSYEEFPRWVVGQPWPIVNFVDTGGGGYASSEGVYDWGAAAIELGYAFGWTDEPNLEMYGDIRRGFRGEYRYADARVPELYLSPIDGQLHLVGARGGLWNLGEGRYLRLANLFDDDHVDAWELVEKFREDRRETDPEVSGRPPRGRAEGEPDEEPAERVDVHVRLLDLGGTLLLARPEGIVLRKHEVEPARFTIRPPSDAASWRRFRDRTASIQGQQRDPAALERWIDDFDGPTLTLAGVRVEDLQASGDELRLLVSVAEDASADGDLEVEALAALPPGRHVLGYDRDTGSWKRMPAAPARLDVELEAQELTAWRAATLEVRIRNDGPMHRHETVRLMLGDHLVASWPDLDLAAGTTMTRLAAWSASAPGSYEAVLQVGEERTSLGTVVVGETPRPPRRELLALSIASSGTFAFLGLLGLVGSLGLWSLWRTWMGP